jgi:hypothetical protein
MLAESWKRRLCSAIMMIAENLLRCNRFFQTLGPRRYVPAKPSRTGSLSRINC